MTSLPPNADELVSAYLDGEAAPDEVATVESNPELLARVASLRTISGLVGTPTPARSEQKEAHLAAALDAFDALFAEATPDSEHVSVSPPLSPPSTTPSPVADPPNATNDATPTTDASDGVNGSGIPSLAAARERRTRRFSPGLIAAAAVAVIFVVIAAFGFGGSSNDVASDSSDAAADTAAAASDEGSDAGDDAMDDAESAAEDAGGLSELEASRAAPAPSPPAAAAMAVPEGDADDAMADTVEEASEAEDAGGVDEEESAAEDDAASAADTADAFAAPFFLGDFPDEASLREELSLLPDQSALFSTLALEPGLFAGCQPEIAALKAVETVTLIAEATIAGQPVEIHVAPGEQPKTSEAAVLIVDQRTCTSLPAE